MKPFSWVTIGAVSGAIAVALGAFGAHALRNSLTPEQLSVWETAVHYQFLHALALVLFGLSLQVKPRRCLGGWFFVAGSALFSGSLYGLTLGGPRWLGPITPLGGTLLILGWIAFAWSAWRKR